MVVWQRVTERKGFGAAGRCHVVVGAPVPVGECASSIGGRAGAPVGVDCPRGHWAADGYMPSTGLISRTGGVTLVIECRDALSSEPP